MKKKNFPFCSKNTIKFHGIFNIYFGTLLCLLLNFNCDIIATPIMNNKKDSVYVPTSVFDQNEKHYKQVQELNPVGYWPADEGSEDILHDRSGNKNHGKLYNVPWRDGLLFLNRSYQWIEIPTSTKYANSAYAFGCWIYNRAPGYNKEGSLVFGSNTSEQGYINGGGVGLFLRGMFRGSDPSVPNSGWASRFAEEVGGLLVNFTAGEQRDAIGSLDAGIAVGADKWQHLFYTYEPGVQEVTKVAGNRGARRDTYKGGIGKLYLDGKLVHTGVGVPAGNWGNSLIFLRDFDGAGRNFTLFNRTLNAEEIQRLAIMTEPKLIPQALAEDEPLKSLLANLNRWQTRVEATTMLVRLNDLKARFALIAKLVTFARLLQDGSQPAEERATAILAIREVHNYFAPQRKDRFPGSAALYSDSPDKRLGSCGILVAAIPLLTKTLEEILAQEGVHTPRIDDLVRNSVIRALLDMAPQDKKVRTLLGQALAKPIFDSLDLSAPNLDNVRALIQKGQYLDALAIYREHRLTKVLAIRGMDSWTPWLSWRDEKALGDFLKRLPMCTPEHDAVFISQGNPWLDARMPGTNSEAYTTVATSNGTTYITAIQKIGQSEVEKIYHDQLEKLSNAGPDGAKGDNRVGDLGELTPQWARLQLIKIEADGRRETVFPFGDWFIFDLRDGKMGGWSLGIDSEGRIHLIGGMHNRPNPVNYLPGVWEKMGLSTKLKDKNYPAIMYWVSEKPKTITAFTFQGLAENPGNIPTPAQFNQPGGLNYINFVTNRKTGTLFCYGRVYVDDILGGRQSLGLYRFNTKTKSWATIGGNPVDIIRDCDSAHPGWSNKLIQSGGKSDKLTKTDARVMAWAWYPGFYNFIRGWGVRFDRTGRMHLRMPLNALDAEGRVFASDYYAFSDDEGDTWHRANGDSLKLPLTINPAPGHNADMNNHGTRQWWDLWESLLLEAGYSLAQPMNPGKK
ncbi:MAG: hypothetical protein ACOYM7_05755 [Paludibacter sp.]